MRWKKYIICLIVALLSCSGNVDQGDGKAESNRVYSDRDSTRGSAAKPFIDGSSDEIEINSDTTTSTVSEVIFVKNFYKEYFEGIELHNQDAIMFKYCTPKLYDRLRKTQLSYDPFINAQDYPDDLLDRMLFVQDTLSKHVIVSYTDDYSGDVHYIELSLIKKDSLYKIGDILISLQD